MSPCQIILYQLLVQLGKWMFRIRYIIIKQETHHNFTLVGADLLAREKNIWLAIIFSKGLKGEGLGNSTPKFALTEPEKC